MGHKGGGRERLRREPAPALRLLYSPSREFGSNGLRQLPSPPAAAPAVATESPQNNTPPPASRKRSIDWNNWRLQGLLAANHQESARRNGVAPAEPISTASNGREAGHGNSQPQLQIIHQDPTQKPSQQSQHHKKYEALPEFIRASEVNKNQGQESTKLEEGNERVKKIEKPGSAAPTPRNQQRPRIVGSYPSLPSNFNAGGFSGNRGARNGFTPTPQNNYTIQRTHPGQLGRGSSRGGRRGNGNSGGTHQFQQMQQPNTASLPGHLLRNCKCGFHHPPVDRGGNVIRPSLPSKEQLERQARCDVELSRTVRAPRVLYSGKPTESGQFLGLHPDYHHETSEVAFSDLENTQQLINGIKLPTNEEKQGTILEMAISIRDSINTWTYQIETYPPCTVAEILTDADMQLLFFQEFDRLLEFLEQINVMLPIHLRQYPRHMPDFMASLYFAPQASPSQLSLTNSPQEQNEPPIVQNDKGCLYCDSSPCICAVTHQQSNGQPSKPQALRPEAPVFEGLRQQPIQPNCTPDSQLVTEDSHLVNEGVKESIVAEPLISRCGSPETAIRNPLTDCDCMWCEDGYYSLCLKKRVPRATKKLPRHTWPQDIPQQAIIISRMFEIPFPIADPRCAFCTKTLCLTCNMGVDSPEAEPSSEKETSTKDKTSRENEKISENVTVSEDETRGESGSDADDEDEDDEDEKSEQEEARDQSNEHQPLSYLNHLASPESLTTKGSDDESPIEQEGEKEDEEQNEKDYNEEEGSEVGKNKNKHEKDEEEEEESEITLMEDKRSLIDIGHAAETQLQLASIPSSSDSTERSEDWTTLRLHSVSDSKSRTSLDLRSEKDEGSDIATTQAIPDDLDYLFTCPDLPRRPTSPLECSEHWNYEPPPTTTRHPFKCLARPTTRTLDPDRVRVQVRQAVLCLLCIFEQDWQQYAEIYYSMVPFGDGWRQIHAKQMQDYFGDAWFGEHDRAYRLGSMTEKMEKIVKICGRPAWDVEHSYL